MVLMLIRSMGTEANFHAQVSSRTAHVARSPRLRRGALSPTGSRRVVLRANFDSHGMSELVREENRYMLTIS
jgi:hypothetical protein